MVKVLMVCLGNICRSPMAEAVLLHKIEQAGLSEQIAVDSAGTGSWHIGEAAHKSTRSQLAKVGINYIGCARQLRAADFREFDYILAMDAQNLRDIQYLQPEATTATIKLFLDYAPTSPVREVPDPYYTGEYEHVYNLIEPAAEGLLQAIRAEHRL